MINYKRVLDWLNDAYAMETGMIDVLEQRVRSAKEFPAIRKMFESHLRQTRQHAKMVAQCIERIGGARVAPTPAIGSPLRSAWSPTDRTSRDEVVRNCLVDYAAEQFEVVTYQALIEAASQVGDAQTVRVCEQIMREDQAMADRIVRALPMVVAAQLAEQEFRPTLPDALATRQVIASR
jgi:ferritin-like metal-binding protein YciE